MDNAQSPRPRRRGGQNSGGGDDREPGGDDERSGGEPIDDPREHLAIEAARFLGSLPATPERYAQAREQWYALPGAVARPSMDPPVVPGQPGTDEPGDEVTSQ